MAQQTFFTSDHHFGHEGVIRMCARPFTTCQEMDDVLVANWNGRVGPGDDVYHLGDFSMGSSPERCQALFAGLRGRKHLIIGNHDKRRVLDLPWASPPRDLLSITVEDQRLILCHYAMRSWPGVWRGALHLFGHTHNTLRGTSRSCDVGVDAWHFRPVTLSEIRERLAESEALPEELARGAAGETHEQDD